MRLRCASQDVASASRDGQNIHMLDRSGSILGCQCREDYLNLVSIVRAHGLHRSPRVSLAAFG